MSDEERTGPGVRVGGWVPPLTGSHPRTFPEVVPAAVEPVRPPEPGDPVLIASHRRRTPWVGLAVLAVIAAAGAVALVQGPEPRPRFAVPGTVVLPSGPPLSAVPYLPLPPTATVAATTSPPASARPAAPTRARTSSAPPPAASAGPRPGAPSGAAARQLTPGGTVALQPVGRPGYRLRHRDFVGRVERVGPDSPPVARADAAFVVRPGLADPGCVSLESVNYRRHYLRHQDFVLRLQPRDGTRLYAADATFCEVRAGGGVTLRSVNHPDRYLADVRSVLWLRRATDSAPTAFVVRRSS